MFYHARVTPVISDSLVGIVFVAPSLGLCVAFSTVTPNQISSTPCIQFPQNLLGVRIVVSKDVPEKAQFIFFLCDNLLGNQISSKRQIPRRSLTDQIFSLRLLRKFYFPRSQLYFLQFLSRLNVYPNLAPELKIKICLNSSQEIWQGVPVAKFFGSEIECFLGTYF